MIKMIKHMLRNRVINETNPWEKLDYFTIIPLEAGTLTVVYATVISYVEDEDTGELIEDGNYTLDFQYSKDNGETWFNCYGDVPEDTYKITINVGEIIKFKGGSNLQYWLNDIQNGYANVSNGWSFRPNGKFSVAGCPISLWTNNDDFSSYENYYLPRRALEDLFYGEYGYPLELVEILNPRTFLPSKRVSDGCYARMFYNCNQLINAPDLPANTLGDMCYYAMFKGCTSLISAPELPALTLVHGCYQNMFMGCTSLTVAPELPSLTLVTSCYVSMFSGCTSLNYIKAKFTSIPGRSTNGWVSNVASYGTFVKNKDATWNTIGENGIPIGWTVILE